MMLMCTLNLVVALHIDELLSSHAINYDANLLAL